MWTLIWMYRGGLFMAVGKKIASILVVLSLSVFAVILGGTGDVVSSPSEEEPTAYDPVIASIVANVSKSQLTRLASDALAGVPYVSVEGFDASAPPYYLREYASNESLEPGRGYWIRVSSDTVWTIQN
ncbi:MAG: hypothetical protein KAU99_02280 [Thermoplasmata archaeon]|nr:hypothetical protein [Thermoplasmata archaeon]